MCLKETYFYDELKCDYGNKSWTYNPGLVTRNDWFQKEKLHFWNRHPFPCQSNVISSVVKIALIERLLASKFT